MAYLTQEDLKQYLTPDEIAALDGDGTKVDAALANASDHIKDALEDRYNIAAELARSGSSRKSTLVAIGCHLAVWELCSISPLVSPDEKKGFNYQNARKDLEKVRQGELLNSLDKYSDPSKGSGKVVFGQSIHTKKKR